MAKIDRQGRSRGSGVTHDAIEKIRELIASGEWGPGTRLPREADLAAQLGLSRNSLREAVRTLARAGARGTAGRRHLRQQPRAGRAARTDELRHASAARAHGPRALRGAPD